MFAKSLFHAYSLNLIAASAVALCGFSATFAQGPPPRPKAPMGPWMNKSLSADERADLLVKEMTLDEKIGLVHGFRPASVELPPGANLAGNRSPA